MVYKTNTHKAAQALSAEKNLVVIKELIASLN